MERQAEQHLSQHSYQHPEGVEQVKIQEAAEVPEAEAVRIRKDQEAKDWMLGEEDLQEVVVTEVKGRLEMGGTMVLKQQ